MLKTHLAWKRLINLLQSEFILKEHFLYFLLLYIILRLICPFFFFLFQICSKIYYYMAIYLNLLDLFIIHVHMFK